VTDTRGPAPGKVPPHVRDRLEDKRRKAALRAQRGAPWQRPPALAAAAVLVLLIGLAIGLGLSADPSQAAADQIAREVLPLANQAEAVFRVGVAGGGSIAEAAQALELSSDTSLIEDNLQAWTDEHQRLLDEFDAVEVDPLAQPLLGLFRASVRAQFDAVVLMGAAAAHDGAARAEFLRAAVREIGRSRELLRDARLALAELGGPETPAVEVPTVPGLTRPGDALPDPLPEPDTEGAPEEPAATASPS